MTAFIPVNTAKLHKSSDGFSVTGDRLFEKPVPIGVSIVRLATNVTQTSVRADKSGTKSYADEMLEKGRLLVHPKHKVREGDRVEILGELYEISGVRPVFGMDGKIDHFQVEL